MALRNVISQVSWVRHNDVGLISVGKFQYIRDPRFKIVHAPRSQEWLLVIRAVRFGDEGPYECQVNTSPIRRETVYLTVVGKPCFRGVNESVGLGRTRRSRAMGSVLPCSRKGDGGVR